MIDAPYITETAAQTISFIHLQIPREEIRQVMGLALQKMFSAIKAQDITPVGP